MGAFEDQAPHYKDGATEQRFYAIQSPARIVNAVSSLA
jgi:hypothetical protein